MRAKTSVNWSIILMSQVDAHIGEVVNRLRSGVISNVTQIDSFAPISISSLMGFFPPLGGEIVGETSISSGLRDIRDK